MRIAILGTGSVGQALGTRLDGLGHEVIMGSRDAANSRAVEWAASHGTEHGTYAEAVDGADLVINATAGATSLLTMEAAGGNAALAGKVLLDVSNPMDISSGELRLTVVNGDSMGEQLQRTLPDAQVVKSLNTVNASVMVQPRLVPGSHTMFIAGDHVTAKHLVVEMLKEFGWPEHDILDLGGITEARGMEMLLPLWVSIMKASDGNLAFNIQVVKG